MNDGSRLPKVSSKVIAIAVAAILVIIAVGVVSCSGGGNKPVVEKKVTKAEATKAKKKGLELYRQGKWDGAMEELKKAAEGNPQDMHTQFQLAYTYEQKGQLDNAYKQYEQILKIDKSSADAHYSMGRVLMQKKELSKAIEQFETAAKMDTDFTSVRADLAIAYAQAKDYKKALATYDELAKLIKSDALYVSRIHVAKGQIYEKMGEDGSAKAEFEKALKLDKNNKEAAEALK